MGAAPGEQDDGLEEARLARRVGTPQDLGARPEGEIERRVAAQVAQADRLEQDPAPGGDPAS